MIVDAESTSVVRTLVFRQGPKSCMKPLEWLLIWERMRVTLKHSRVDCGGLNVLLPLSGSPTATNIRPIIRLAKRCSSLMGASFPRILHVFRKCETCNFSGVRPATRQLAKNILIDLWKRLSLSSLQLLENLSVTRELWRCTEGEDDF